MTQGSFKHAPLLLALLVLAQAGAAAAQEPVPAPPTGSEALPGAAGDPGGADTVGNEPGEAVTDDEDQRQAVYDAFRREFDANRFDAALPLAQQLVRLIEAQEPLSDRLPTAYNNLGATQFRLGDLAAAEVSFGQALELLEATQGIASRRLVPPLAGLGSVYAAQGQHGRAADALQRAVAINRRGNGLFNLEQLDLLEALIGSYEAMGAFDGVEQERRYALQVVQQQYGRDDPRTLPAITALALFYERQGRYAAARLLWARSVAIGGQEGGGRNLATINGLIGISRTHRLQYVRDPESLAPDAPIDPFTGRPDSMMVGATRPSVIKLDKEGEKAGLDALDILDGTADPPQALLARVLLELGDWYVTAREPHKALPHYTRAWPLLPATLAPGESHPLAVPRPLLYRAPPGAIRHRGRSDVVTVARRMEFKLSIDEQGRVQSVVALPGEAADVQLEQVVRALGKAFFSPRFEDGRPVATDDFLFTEYWHDIAPPPAEAAPEAASPAEEAAGEKAQPDAEVPPPPAGPGNG